MDNIANYALLFVLIASIPFFCWLAIRAIRNAKSGQKKPRIKSPRKVNTNNQPSSDDLEVITRSPHK